MLPLYVIGPVVLIAVAAELLWSRHRRAGLYTLKESLASVGTAAVNQVGVVVSLGWKYLVLAGAASFVPWSIPLNAATIVVGFLAVEFFYYWYHRAGHEIPALWSMHFVHHSSPEYNLLVAPRLSFLANFTTPFFFVPLVVIGFSAEFVLVTLAVGLFLQLFLHTQAIGTLGPLEGIVNTPSAHRVHHGTNEQYIDRNYGSTLLIFDRLFGTYEPEGETVRYGVTTGHWGYNPLRLQFAPAWRFVRGAWKREREVVADREPAVVS
ncbi:MAG: sterol desaturase family protein [Actinomycetota bacterium]